MASKLQFGFAMKMTNLNQFFRDAGAAIRSSTEVRKAVSQATKQIETTIAKEISRSVERFSDRFEAPKAKPAAVVAQAATGVSDGDFVKGLYRELLKREPDIGGFNAHVAGLARGMSRDEIRQNFLNSPEFAELQSKPAVTEPTAPDAPVAAPKNDFGNATKLGPVPLEGFDNRKLTDPNYSSVKYLFGRVATHFPLNEVHDKASAEALLNKMVPDLQAAGLDILGVKGDRLLMKTPLGVESIDVVRGAGAPNPGFWWGADGTVASAAEIAKFPPLAAPRPAEPTQPTQPAEPGALVEPGEPLRTVPLKPEYLEANIDKSSPEAAALSAAKWARVKYADLFLRAADRNVCAEIMGHVIGALRVAGYDATRVVNHPSLPDGARWGSDAVVINGNVFDVYRAMGEASDPVAQNQGPYEAGRLRE